MADFHIQSLAHLKRPVTEHQSPTAVQKVDAGSWAVRGKYYVGATYGMKVQVIVQRGRNAPDHPRDAESSRGRWGWGGGGRGGGAAANELSVVIELEVGHLGSSCLVVLQLIVAVIGWVVATLGQIGTQTGSTQAAGSHTLSKCAFCGGEYGQIKWLGHSILWSFPSQLRTLPLFSLIFSYFLPWSLRKNSDSLHVLLQPLLLCASFGLYVHIKGWHQWLTSLLRNPLIISSINWLIL